ncbi:mannitol dehydrogenase family protein [Pararhizobium haloflavum]|uniref:mannitol dehydrogenase family protein n=1 Tax=Pararhizobium haloflavum TaxID=2037914 RepID=UPI000C175758|nr:mannitol dehydrogenase family protein [Pararhizobium haloflavum]
MAEQRNAALTAGTRPLPAVASPAYIPEDHGCGIVHIGVGAFHRAHQAVYTDAALSAAGGDWRIIGVSLRSRDQADRLNPQDGRYSLIVRHADRDEARLVASIDKVIVAPDDPAAVIAAIADPATRIVTITVTEKAYPADQSTGRLDIEEPTVRHDLDHPTRPKGLIGYLHAGLKRRHEAGSPPLTVISCDNLPANGRLLRRLVEDFAERAEPCGPTPIGENVRFPSSMVDRITPATTSRTYSDAERLIGCSDAAAVETEPFTQWVIEDDFAGDRPAWDKAGALFVADVEPYERMKLRMLNGTHSLLAYAGHVAGYTLIAQCVADSSLAAVARMQMRAAAGTLPPIAGVDLDTYASDLMQRFSNKAIRHETYQIAMDGTQKLPPRICMPIAENIAAGQSIEPFAFVIAAWMRYCLGETDSGERYALRDPREDEINRRLAGAPREANALYAALAPVLPGFGGSPAIVEEAVTSRLDDMLNDGMCAAIEAEHASGSAQG